MSQRQREGALNVKCIEAVGCGRRNEISVEGAEGKIRISGVKGRCCRERRESHGNVEEILKKKREHLVEREGENGGRGF